MSTSTSPPGSVTDPKSAEHAGVILNSLFKVFQTEITAAINTNLQYYPLNDESKRNKDTIRASREPSKDKSKQQLTEVNEHPHLKHWLHFPRDISFFGDMIQSISQVAQYNFEVLFSLLLSWLPQRAIKDSEELLSALDTESWCSFTTFVQGIKGFKLSDQRTLDLLELVVVYIISELLRRVLGVRAVTQQLTGPALHKLFQMAVNFFKPMTPRAMESSAWSALNQGVLENWITICGCISPFVLPQISEYLAKVVTKMSAEQQNSVLHGLSAIKLNVTSSELSEESKNIVSRVLPFIILKDKNTLRAGPLEVLDSALLSIDFSHNPVIDEKARAAYKFLQKLNEKGDDSAVEGPALRLMATILAHGPHEYYFKHAHSYISKTLLKGAFNPKKKDACLEAILRLLQGRHVPGTDSPYTYLPFMEMDKSKDKLMSIYEGLFGQKTPLPRVNESLDLCAEILLQIGAHVGVKALHEGPLTELFNSPHHVHVLLALRVTRRLTLPDLPLKAPRDTLEALSRALSKMSRALSELNADCPGRADLAPVTLVDSEQLTRVIDETVDQNIPLDTAISAQEERALRDKFKAIQSRLKRCATSTSEELESEEEKSLYKIDQFVQDRIKIWSSVVNELTANSYVQPIFEEFDQSSDETKAVNKRTIFNKPATKRRVLSPERSVQHELFKEVITCLESLLPDEQTLELALLPDEKLVLQVPGEEGSFIGRYVLHSDDEVSGVCAHFLQHVLLTQPSLRASVIKAMCALVLQLNESAEQQHHNVRSALHHLLLLVDLWVFALIRANSREGVPSVPLSLILKLERVALLMMSHWSASVRGVALDLAHSAQCLATLAVQHTTQDRAHIVTRRLAYVLDKHSAQIIQNARWHFFLYLTNGIDKDVKMNHTAAIQMTLAHIAKSTQDVLWSHVLSEIGRLCVQYEFHQLLTKLRHVLLSRLKALSGVLNESADSVLLPVIIARNYRTLFMATSTPDLDVVRRTDKPATPRGEESARSELGAYLEECWKLLLKDNALVAHTVQYSLGCVHPLAWGTVLDSMWRWYASIKRGDSKKRNKARGCVVYILRTLATHRQFRQFVTDNDKAVAVCAELLKDLAALLEECNKTSSLLAGPVVLDHLVLLIQFARAVAVESQCCKRGPLRWYLQTGVTKPAVLQILTGPDRYQLYQQLIRWCGTGKTAQPRVALDQAEATRLLNKIKDSARRDSKKIKYERVVRAVQSTAAQAIEQLFRLESLLPPTDLKTVRKLILDWMLPAEIVHGTRILRWMMSIYFEETFPLFIDKCYSESVKESIYFINAVYDQFLPVKVSPPHNGIADDVRIHFSDYLAHKQRRVALETQSSSAFDKTFTAQISAHAGALLYLALYNLVHQSSVLRVRSYKLLVRLVPVAFGLLHPHTELEASYTRDKLLQHKSTFCSKVDDTSKKSALDVVAVASKQCQLFTEDLFAEIFTRFKSVSIEGKCWTLHCMLPWLDNIVLQDDVAKKPGSLKRYSTSEFLEQLFTYMTVLLALRPDTSELFVQLWHRLAKTATNISPVVSFLLKRGLGNKNHLEICKSIILSLYKVNAPATLKQIIPHLSVKGIIDFILTSNTPPMMSTTDEVPAVRNSPGPSRQSPVKPILGLARQLSLLWPQRATSPSKYDKFNKVPPINVNVAPGSPSRTKNREVSFQIREVSVALLTDFATENIVPLLSHVHIIFNYAILRMDSNEAHNLSRLLYVILIAIKRTFKADKKLADLPCVTPLDNLVRLLKTVSFKLKWNFKSTGPEAAPSTDATTNQLLEWATNAIDVATLIQLLIECCQPIEPQVQKQWADEALNWAIEYKDLGLSTKSFEMYKNITNNTSGAKVIEDKISRTTIKRLVRVLDETLRGLDEAFSTLSSISVNTKYSTKAAQSPRSDATADAVEPQGPPTEGTLQLSDPANSTTDKTTPRFTLASSSTGAPLAAQGPLSASSNGSDSLSSPRGRRSSGSGNLPLPSFRETPATPSSANNSATNSGTVTPSGRDSSESSRTPVDATAAQYRRLQHLAEDNIQLLTARAVEILTTLQKIAAVLHNAEFLLYIFWTAQSMLKIAPLRLPRVYEEALRLLSVLLQNAALRPVLESPEGHVTYTLLRERSALVDVTCLQELVLPGLYLPQTELLAAAVLSELNSSRSELVCASKARHVLWLLSFVPWLDAHLMHADLRIKIAPSLDHVIAALESSPGHFTTIADILQRYQAGDFDQNPALFLELIGSELYSIGFVPYAREVINVIAILCNYSPRSAWRLARLFTAQPHAAKHAPDFRALVQEAAQRSSQGDQSAASFINELAGLLDRATSNKLVFASSVLDWTPHVELGDPRTNLVITCLRTVSTLVEEQSKQRKENKEKRRAAVRVNAAKDKPSKDKTPRHHVRAKSTMVTSPRRSRDKEGTVRDKPRDKKEDRMSLSLAQVTITPRDGPKSASTSPRTVEPLKMSAVMSDNESDGSEDLDFDLSLAEDLIGDDDKLESLKKQLQMNFGEEPGLTEVREDDEDEDEDSMDSFDLDMEGADDAFFKAFDLEEKESSKLDDDFNSLMSSLNNPGVLTGNDDDLTTLPSLPYEVDSIQKALHGLKLLESNDSSSAEPKNSTKTDSGVSTPSSMPSTPTTAPSSPFTSAADTSATQLSDIFDKSQVRRVFKSFVEKNNLDKALVDLAEALYDYRNNIISGTSSMSTKAKLIMQRFFPKSSSAAGSSSIPDTLKRETIKAYEAALLSGKFSKSLFEKIEAITTHILHRDYFPLFVKSDLYAQITQS